MSPKTYDANCHCGSVKYQVTLSEALAPEGSGKILSCNCSICFKNGYLLVYPLRPDVKFLAGEDKLKDYFFGKKNKPHRFCGECSSSILIDFKNSNFESEREMLAMNVRMFNDVDIKKADYRYFDGRAKLEPSYEV
ncbi:hypothetical protein K431DRAFT_289202 [Polychaeton citri CBS 116435]|uniref:CENP-V/GFA domain-containing protein n=1 Tax=Polychaeton citri CBS 116435 TaxID=1314669 RepID=A0A9P4Q225_9PEZI|nr:hypothetical protein K431DRAFT_289202 [Polychaeton citri CBS 116435]